MKTTRPTLRKTILAILTALIWVFAAGGATAATDEKTYSGTLTFLDKKEKTVKVGHYMFSKTFVLANNCVLTVIDKKEASPADFRPGQKVTVGYKNASGVLVANSITQEKLAFSGKVSSIDPVKHKLTVKDRGGSRTFAMDENLAIVLNGGARGKMDDVKLGSQVTVIYEIPNNNFVVRQIEQKSARYVGTLDSINLADRTINSGKRLLGDKKFHLADNCVILVKGKPDGQMSDLRLGQTYELAFDTVDGVNVVNRIAPVETPAPQDILKTPK